MSVARRGVIRRRRSVHDPHDEEIAGGEGFYRGFGLERLFRDVQAARYHPLPESDQTKFSGEYLLRD